MTYTENQEIALVGQQLRIGENYCFTYGVMDVTSFSAVSAQYYCVVPLQTQMTVDIGLLQSWSFTLE